MVKFNKYSKFNLSTKFEPVFRFLLIKTFYILNYCDSQMNF